MNVLVVVVTYRAEAFIDECLDAIGAAAQAAGNEHTVDLAVVDNSPDEATSEVLRRRGTPFVRCSENPGFGRAVNLAIEAAAPGWDMAVLVNPDALLTATSLDRLCRAFAADAGLGIAAPAMVLPSGERGYAGGSAPRLIKELVARLGLDRLVPRRLATTLAASRWTAPLLPRWARDQLRSTMGGIQPVPLDWVSGFCMAIRRDAWRATGGFDPRFFLYFEDVDLCLRARRMGWAVSLLPDVGVAHRESLSTSTAGKGPLYRGGLRTYFSVHGGPVERRVSPILWRNAA